MGISKRFAEGRDVLYAGCTGIARWDDEYVVFQYFTGKRGRGQITGRKDRPFLLAGTGRELGGKMLRLIGMTGLIILMFMSGTLYAGDADILPVTPALDFTETDTECLIPEFDEIGTIDRISETDIVINDCIFKLSSATAFYSKTGKRTSRSDFSERSVVGIVLNSNRQVISIWKYGN